MKGSGHHRITASGRLWIPATVLAIGLTATAIAWHLANNLIKEHDDQRFAVDANHLASEIEERIATYEEVLLGGVALFAASTHVSRAEWNKYVSMLEVDTRLPGIQGIGFASQIQPEDLSAHVDAMQANGYSDYEIRPAGTREVYTSIIYLEPFDWRNRRAFGFDMFTETTRREAMERARDEGTFAMSAKVELVQETDEDTQAGFLLYHPVYTSSKIPSTVAERRHSLQGYVL